MKASGRYFCSNLHKMANSDNFIIDILYLSVYN